MNDFKYEFEGRDLTKEVVMVMVRDEELEKWEGPYQIGAIIGECYIDHKGITWNFAKLYKQTLRDLYNTAPDGYRELLFANTDDDRLELPCSGWTYATHSNASFIFSIATEGDDFWVKFFDHMMRPNLNELPPLPEAATHRPWTMETAEPVMLRNKDPDFRYKRWFHYDKEKAWYCNSDGVVMVKYDDLFKDFEQLNGTPAGEKI